jgi:hypothetical protein
MSGKLCVMTLIAFGAVSLHAQTSESRAVQLGFKVGIPVTEMFSTSNNQFGNVPGAGFSFHQPRYEFGVTGEFKLPRRLRFEIDGLYKRGGFNSALPWGNTGQLAFRPTTFNSWEIPGLFKYQFSAGHFRPFVDFGAALRHISTVGETTSAPGVLISQSNDNSIALHNRNSFGGVAGIGLMFKRGPFELSPEVRYTRWANSSFQYGSGFRTNLDQGDVLLGITF